MSNLIKLILWMALTGLLTSQCTNSDERPTPTKSSAISLGDLAVNGIRVRATTYADATAAYYLLIPTGTDLQTIKLSFSLPTGASSVPVSGTIQDFTKPVTYTITAADGSTKSIAINMAF